MQVWVSSRRAFWASLRAECNDLSNALRHRALQQSVRQDGGGGRGLQKRVRVPDLGQHAMPRTPTRFWWRKMRRGAPTPPAANVPEGASPAAGRRKNNWRAEKLASHRRPPLPECVLGFGVCVCRWGFGAGRHLFPLRSIRPPDAHARGWPGERG